MNKKTETAVSELIAAVLLIGVVVASIGIIGIIVSRDIVPTKLPHLDFEACVDNNALNSTNLYLYHTGGDTLKPKESNADFYVVLLDKNDRVIGRVKNISWNKDQWAAGDVQPIYNIINPSQTTINKAQIVAKPPGGGDALIEWAQVRSCSQTGTLGPGCLARAYADFSADPESSLIVPQPVIFHDESLSDDPTYNITSWEWDFGDGSPISPEKNPVHTFTAAGTYQVRLRANNACGTGEISHPIIAGTQICPSTVIASFTTVPNPPVTLTNPTLPVTFDASGSVSSGSTIQRYEWDFGDGTPTTTGSLVSHTYSYGIYFARLTVTDACGHWDSIQKQISVTSESDCFITPGIRVTPANNGTSPYTVTLTDASTTSRGRIDSWYWEFGDGTLNSTQGPHTKTYGNLGSGSKTFYVNLTVRNSCGATRTTTELITVKPPCEPVVASFSWDTPLDFDPYKFQFHSPLKNCGEIDPNDCEYYIDKSEWDFGDVQGNTSNNLTPLHTFPEFPYDPIGKNITLTVWNSCGNSSTIQRPLTVDCPPLIANMTVTPLIGKIGQEVFFNDTSTSVINITSWRWNFGDRNSSTNRNTSNIYDRTGTFYATLTVTNKCWVEYLSKPIAITITDPANISGHLWNDQNLNGIQEVGEPNLSGWRVDLEEYVGSSWVARENTTRLIDGNYLFSRNIANGIFRVRETLPSSTNWKVTYSYNSDKSTISGIIPISTVRNYNKVDFGNIEKHTSSFQFPGHFHYFGDEARKKPLIANFRASPYFDYWQYSTSYNPAVQEIAYTGTDVYPINPPYEVWGNSSFWIKVEDYDQYWVNFPQGSTSWLNWWEYQPTIGPLQSSSGFYFTVPDNTTIKSNQMNLYYTINNSQYLFEFSKPKERESIPFSKNIPIEVHFVGPGRNDTGCSFVAPDKTVLPLSWNSYLYLYTGTWNATKGNFSLWEGQKGVTLNSSMVKTSAGGTVNCSVKVDFGWDPIYAYITNITSDPGINLPNIKGITTVTANVTGKWRDNLSVSLILDNGEPILMKNISSIGLNTTLRATFNAETYAGKTFPVMVRASPIAGHGDDANSTVSTVTANSKLPLVANFTADPWSGPVPLEVFFNDVSTGGPTSWSWNFKDGNTSTIQDNLKIFSETGNYSVNLTVGNGTATNSTQKWVNISGFWHDVTLLTSRPGSLKSGGYQRFNVFGAGSSQTVNNTSFIFNDTNIVQSTLLSDLKEGRVLIDGPIMTFNISNISLSVNDIFKDKGNSTQISIPLFQNYHSTMSIVMDPNKTAYINLIWDGVTIPYTWRQTLTISNLMPTSNKRMDFDMSANQVFFSGRASNYTLT